MRWAPTVDTFGRGENFLRRSQSRKYSIDPLDNTHRTPITVISAVIILMALVSSFAALKIAPDFETAGKQLAILWAVVLATIWLLGSLVVDHRVLRVIGILLAASAVLATAYLIWTKLGNAGLTWTAAVTGGLFVVGLAWKLLTTILGSSMGTITLLAVLFVGGIYYLSSR